MSGITIFNEAIEHILTEKSSAEQWNAAQAHGHNAHAKDLSDKSLNHTVAAERSNDPDVQDCHKQLADLYKKAASLHSKLAVKHAKAHDDLKSSVSD